MIEWNILFRSSYDGNPVCIDCIIADRRLTLYTSLYDWIFSYPGLFNDHVLESKDLESAKEETINLVEASLQSALKDIQEYKGELNK